MFVKLAAVLTCQRLQHDTLIPDFFPLLCDQVADQLAAISKGSELFDAAGQLPSESVPKHEVCSYASIHHNLASRTKTYADKYGTFVINYAIEWDKIVTARVSTGLNEAEKLRRDLDHYQKKTESLRAGVGQVVAKGKQVDSKQEVKLGRNEEKLSKAKLEYNKVATNMCILIEEVTERAWKDIHPMLLKIAQFDAALSSDETKELSELNQVEEKLKKLAEVHQLKPQNRLKDLETMTPTLLSSRKDEGLQIEADPTSSGSFGDMSSPIVMALPPGTVSPQGMGGYPVTIAQPIIPGTSRNSSMSSFSSSNPYGGSMTTSDMLSIAGAAAPPPTMEQITDATRSSLVISTSPTNQYSSSFGAPPSQNGYQRSSSMPGESYPYQQQYAPSSMNGGYGRSSSNASYGGDSSVASYASAPAPYPTMAPPPPPPAGMSMYASAPAVPMYSHAPAPMSAPLPPTYGQQPGNPWSTAAPTNQFGAPPPLTGANPYGTNPYGNQF
jgi:hypothetical protein